MKWAAILLAAGRGARAGDGVAKTYRHVNGQMVLTRAIHAFVASPQIRHIQCVIHPDDTALYAQATAGFHLPPPVFGGATRAQSVEAGLAALDGFDAVLIHDGARPFVSPELIGAVMAAVGNDFDGAIPALPVVDALWRVADGTLIAPVSRDALVRAQTPQAFRLAAYRAAIRAHAEGLDDAEIAIKAGLRVAWVVGAAENQKLTYAEDFR